MMVTVDATNKSSSRESHQKRPRSPRPQLGNCDLIVRGLYGGSPRGFLRLSNGMFQPDSLSEAPVSLADTPGRSGLGCGADLYGRSRRARAGLFALDRNGNGILNDDEPRTSVSITGRVVNASGAGLAGVTVTLSGTQSATFVTDATGRFVFNFVSTTGAHTVTPSGGSFFPQSRTFTSPTWNQSATFSTSPTGNASDVSQFFVTQHYRRLPGPRSGRRGSRLLGQPD